jgi:protein-S-isoprenylcysteine O-methyltransferase Ste14
MSKDKTATKKNQKFSLKDILFTTIFTIVFLTQIALMFIINNESSFTILFYTGWIVWIFSIYFALIPFLTFKKRGEVEKGKSYIYTSKLVKDGAYAIIRHPQYLGGILFSISITLWNPEWFNIILSFIIIILTYQWSYSEDKILIEKFGVNYEIYKKKVPRLNPILGLAKYLAWKKKKSK